MPLALGLLRGTLSVDSAGLRAIVLFGALVAVERVVLPFKALLVDSGPGRRRAGGTGDGPGGRRRSDGTGDGPVPPP
jgi:hypothetical protein